MSIINLFLSLFFGYILFLLLRAKFALKTIQKDFSDYRQNNIYQPTTRDRATAAMRRYINKHESEIIRSDYTLLFEFVKTKMNNKNHNVIYVSKDQETLIEIVYQKLNVTQRLMLALCGSSLSITPETFALAVESSFSNGEALCTLNLTETPFPAWFHATFVDQSSTLSNMLEIHQKNKEELQQTRNLTAIKIGSVDDFCDKEHKQRERLSKQNDLFFEQMVTENNVEWLVGEDPKVLK